MAWVCKVLKNKIKIMSLDRCANVNCKSYDKNLTITEDTIGSTSSNYNFHIRNRIFHMLHIVFVVK